MKMTKQHFELIAETIANLPAATGGESLETFGPYLIDKNLLVRALADLCAGTNGMFDRGRFERACNTENYRAPKNVTRY